jgi:hypothetical protein
MACVQLPADVQGCLNIRLIRGDDKEITLTFDDDGGNPIDLSLYDIMMEVRQGGMSYAPVSVKQPGSGMDVNVNVLTLSFTETDAVYQRDYGVLDYDIAFTKDDVTQHWIKGQITITKSVTETWK